MGDEKIEYFVYRSLCGDDSGILIPNRIFLDKILTLEGNDRFRYENEVFPIEGLSPEQFSDLFGGLMKFHQFAFVVGVNKGKIITTLEGIKTAVSNEDSLELFYRPSICNNRGFVLYRCVGTRELNWLLGLNQQDKNLKEISKTSSSPQSPTAKIYVQKNDVKPIGPNSSVKRRVERQKSLTKADNVESEETLSEKGILAKLKEIAPALRKNKASKKERSSSMTK